MDRHRETNKGHLAMTPPRRPATMTDLLACIRGQGDPAQFTWDEWAPLFDAARRWHEQQQNEGTNR